jgi:hypothetical protein
MVKKRKVTKRYQVVYQSEMFGKTPKTKWLNLSVSKPIKAKSKVAAEKKAKRKGLLIIASRRIKDGWL